MKTLLVTVALFLATTLDASLCAQIFDDTIKFDKMEEFDWAGNWFTGAPTTGFYNNASKSAPTSAVIYGSGGGADEYDWYSLPNETGFDPNVEHKLQINLGSYRFTGTGSTSGVDAADYIDIQVSTDGGLNYVSELRITGNSNAYWDYNSATVTKFVDGILDVIAPTGGGDRTLTGDGWSQLELIFPLGTTQIAVDILAVVDRAGEEWWIDDIFMLGGGGGALPIELLSFDAESTAANNVSVKWSTASQTINDYFTVQRSLSGFHWEDIAQIPGCGNCNTQLDYSYLDRNPYGGISYYRLMQTDYDGNFEIFSPQSVTVSDGRTIGLHIKPNPAIDNIKIDLVWNGSNAPTNHDVRIYNANGVEVYKMFYIGKLNDFGIDIRALKSGYYIVNSKSNGLPGFGKFIKD